MCKYGCLILNSTFQLFIPSKLNISKITLSTYNQDAPLSMKYIVLIYYIFILENSIQVSFKFQTIKYVSWYNPFKFNFFKIV